MNLPSTTVSVTCTVTGTGTIQNHVPASTPSITMNCDLVFGGLGAVNIVTTNLSAQKLGIYSQDTTIASPFSFSATVPVSISQWNTFGEPCVVFYIVGLTALAPDVVNWQVSDIYLTLTDIYGRQAIVRPIGPRVLTSGYGFVNQGNPLGGTGGATPITHSAGMIRGPFPLLTSLVTINYAYLDNFSGNIPPWFGIGQPDWLIIQEPTTGYTDQTKYLFKGAGFQHTFTQQLRQRGQATIQLQVPAGDPYTPTQFTPIYLYDQTATYKSPLVSVWRLAFSGLIQDVEITWIGTRGDRFIVVTAVSLESIFDTVYAPPKQYQDWTCGQIVADLFNRLEAGSPVSLGTIQDGPVVPLLVTNYEKLSELFDQLATTALRIWYVDPATQQLNFVLPSAVPAPFTLASSNILWDTVNWKTTGADYRNRQAVRLSYDAFAHSCEFFVGAGQRTITLMRPVQQVTNAWATLSTCNTATATFTGQPNPGDFVTIQVPVGTWIPNHIYAINGTLIDQNGFVQKITGGSLPGRSGLTYPAFSDITGVTTVDNQVIWTCIGPAGLATGDGVYTFVAALDNTQYGQVLIGATAAETCTNLMDAINATVDDGGSPAIQIRGVKYSLPTWEDSLCNAINQSGSTFTLQQKHAGTGWTATLGTSDAIANFAWSSPTTAGGTSPQGSLGPGEGATISLQVYVQGTSIAAPGVAYTPGSSVVTLATPLNVGSNLNIEYTRADGNIIEVERTDLVTALAALSHGTGKYQQITDASSQGLISTSNVAGLQLAQNALAAFDRPPRKFNFLCYDPGLTPGQQLTILLTLPSGSTALLNGNWVVEEIEAELVPVDWNVPSPYLPGFGHYKYTIHCIDINEVGSWLDFWNGTSGGASGGGAGSGAVATSGGGLQPSPAGATVPTWYQEVPGGTLNGVNVTFTLTHTPVTGSLDLFLNIQQRAGTDFTITGSTITFTTAPKATDAGWFFARYQY